MAWSHWFRRDERKTAGKLQVPGPAGKSPALPLPDEILLEAEELASAYNDNSGHLLANTPRSVSRGARVAVRVSGPGRVVGPLSGVAVSAAPQRSGFRVEIELGEDQRRAVGRILLFLKTGENAPRARPPRYPLALPVFVRSRDGSTYMTTFSVSRGGCGLTWIGEPPRVGSALDLRLGSGQGAVAYRAMVCWVAEHKRGRRVGLRFVAGQEAALVALLKAALTAASDSRSPPAP